jgi:hypothetical protein
MNQRIKVIDSFPGSGKTSWAIEYINKLPKEKKIIYITPFLKECDRIINACLTKNFNQPDVRLGKGRKMDHLIELVTKGENIVSTHALFLSIDDALIEALKMHDYILFLDEAMNVVEKFDLYSEKKGTESQKNELTMADIRTLENKEIIEIKDNFEIIWKDDEFNLYKYEKLKNLIKRQLVFLIDDTLLLWTFPVEVFQEGIFSEIYIMTYQFRYQLQSYYYDFYKVPYSTYHIEITNDKYHIVATKDKSRELQWKQEVKSLIHINEDEKLNKIGSTYYDAQGKPQDTLLSKAWYDRNKRNRDAFKKMADNINNFYRHYTQSKAEERMWTCFKEYAEKIKDKNLTMKQWLELTSRATNDYGDRTALAYCLNRFIIPYYQHFFSQRKIEIDQDAYALSEMLQWIWRSAIRNMKPIEVYIPSERMRRLLKDWLNNLL